MRIRSAFLALSITACLIGCSSPTGDVPNEEAAVVSQVFKDLLRTCSAPLRGEAAIDQSALAAAGWRVSKRTVLTIETNKQVTYAADAYPELEAGDLETTDWSLSGWSVPLYLSRYGVNNELPKLGSCSMHVDVGDRKAANSVVAGVRVQFGRPPDRVGDISMGGDSAGLIPRRDSKQRGYYWRLAQHDVYVSTDRDGLAGLEVVAMPDRSKLGPYSSDRPEIRLYIPQDSHQVDAGTQQASDKAN